MIQGNIGHVFFIVTVLPILTALSGIMELPSFERSFGLENDTQETIDNKKVLLSSIADNAVTALIFSRVTSRPCSLLADALVLS